VVQAFAPDRSAEPLDMSVLPYMDMDPARLQEPLLLF
jgi:hypothetical protein